LPELRRDPKKKSARKDRERGKNEKKIFLPKHYF